MIRDLAIVRRAVLPSCAIVLGFLARGAWGQTCDPATSALGAHLSHVRDGFARSALACTECHPAVCSPDPGVSLVFGPLASKQGAQPRWDPATRTCSGVYCHGATLNNPVGPVAWAWVDPSLVRPNSQQCVICHGYPPSTPHQAVTDCHGCHGATVLASGSIDVAGGHHLDGTLDVSGGACGSCHAIPPATGAHVAHYGLAGGSGYGDLSILQDRDATWTPATAPAVYAFGCGNCHPMGAGHMNGTVDVVLQEAAAPAGTLKARASPSAAYDPVTRTCSGVYCHSGGQADPAFVTTPGWFSGTKPGCNGCHANPPAYPSGGAGTATANSHLNLAEDGYEFGHFLGMPGPTHTSKHGGWWGPGEDAAPITCQTCHYDTTDPSNVGPGGFYYLDTTGVYALPGGDPFRGGWLAWQQCGACHKAGGAATGTGKVLPLRHVNGTRDVVFDPRTALPPGPLLPAAPNTPTRPYWLTNGGLTMLPWPPWVTGDGSTVSFPLNTSTWDPVTKTCTNVACHQAENPVWGRPYLYTGSVTCNACHPM